MFVWSGEEELQLPISWCSVFLVFWYLSLGVWLAVWEAWYLSSFIRIHEYVWLVLSLCFDIFIFALLDCVRAEPVIYKKLEASPDDIALLRAYVGDRPTWRNPQHPWRVDPRFKLTGVPTLIRWENDAVKGRLEDHEAHRENKIGALVADKWFAFVVLDSRCVTM